MTPAQIKNDLDAIADIDPDIKTGLEIVGYPAPRIRAPGFETFLSIIIGQQISTEAAAAVMRRVRERLPCIEATELLALSSEALRAAGLSGRKVEYAKGLAQAIVDGTFDLDRLVDMDDERAIKTITGLRGFGDWSAEIYLMFCLQRRDIFPANDLALQVALQKLKRLEQRPTALQSRALVAKWEPWRSAGSLFLWHYYRGAPG